jgi:hypothetical protein
MTLLHVVVGVLAVAGAGAVLLSVLRSVVLPRGVPTRLTRVTFLAIRAALTLRLRITRATDYQTRDRVFALQAPIGVFGQLFVWSALLFACFAGVFWALGGHDASGSGVAHAFELAGSSMLTLGTDAPHGLLRKFVGFAAAGVGLTLLALVITYVPSLYNAFSRREALISKLIVITGAPPTGPRLLGRTWELHRFAALGELWDQWEDWFVELGESHTSIPQLGFFRSTHPRNHWVLAAEAVLDAAVLVPSACDVERQFRSELCVDAGVQALDAIAEFLGITGLPVAEDPRIGLPRETFDAGCRELAELGVPMRADTDAAWSEFRRGRARYESQLAILGAMTLAPRSDWSSWSEDAPRHSPPLLRIHNRV